MFGFDRRCHSMLGHWLPCEKNRVVLNKFDIKPTEHNKANVFNRLDLGFEKV